MDTKLLLIYPNDHLGGSMGGIELAKRTCEGSEFEPTLARLVTEIQEDRETLSVDLPGLAARAERQRDDIERCRLDGARIAFGAPAAAPAA